jgi:Calcineurin-like phosphoesterase
LKRKKTVIGVAILLVAIGGLWIAGPPPLETGVYLQRVTGDGATFAKVDASARRLTARVWEADDVENPILVSEDIAVVEHAIRVDGLRAGVRYEFEIEADGVRLDGGSFRTAPKDDRATVRFAAVGDSGELPWWYNMHRMGWSRLRPMLAWTRTPQQWHIAEWIDGQDLSFFVHLGDIVYWRQLRDAYEEAFFRPFASMLRDTPLYTLLGNHDVPRDGGVPPFETLFHNPSPPGVGRPNRNFTAVWGSVRLVALDVVDPKWESAATRAWLEQTLAAATEPWIVVATHVPCFTAYHKRTENGALRDRLYPLLARHGVDLVISGDDHHFVRFKPATPGGPIQVVVGAGGKSLYDIRPDDDRVAASAKAWSYLLVEAKGLRLDVRVIGAGGKVYDGFVVDRSRGAIPAGFSAARRARIERMR